MKKLDQAQITEQIEKVIAAAGMASSEQNIYACKWLAANDIPVTTENLTRLQSLQDLQFPLDRRDLLTAMQTAVAEGKTPADAYLVDSASLISRAEDAAEVLARTTDRELAYLVDQGQELTIANLQEAHNLIESGAVTVEET